jgi:hypothetical protein
MHKDTKSVTHLCGKRILQSETSRTTDVSPTALIGELGGKHEHVRRLPDQWSYQRTGS